MRKNIVWGLIALPCFIAIFAGAFHWGAGNRTMPGDRTPDLFPIVVQLPASNPPVFELVTWGGREKFQAQYPKLSFRLPTGEASFRLPPKKEIEPLVRFAVTAVADDQKVHVRWADDNFTIEAVYRVVGDNVTPESMRYQDPGTSFLAFIAAAIATPLLMWLGARVLTAVRRSQVKGKNPSG